MDNNIMSEALAALDGQIKTAPSKVPEGKTVIAIELDRDETQSGRFVTAIDARWLATGRAVAIKDGHVVAANYVFGRVTNGIPKVTACHYVTCVNCGKRVLMPLAVWEAKDSARKRGVEIQREAAGMAVLRAHGSCTCGGKWTLDEEAEKADLSKFTEKALDAISNNDGPIPQFLQPSAFCIVPVAAAKPLPQEWAWLNGPLAPRGLAAVPFDATLKASVVVFNPGFWLGHIDDHDTTGLFWVENGHDRRKHPKASFNPGEVDGL